MLWGLGAIAVGIGAYALVPSLGLVIWGYAALAVTSAVLLGRQAWAWWTSMLALAAPFLLATGVGLLAAGELRGEGCGCALLIVFVVGVMTLLPMGLLWRSRPIF